MARRKSKAAPTIEQRAKRITDQRRAIGKTIRLFAKQLTAHLEEMQELSIVTAAIASAACMHQVRRDARSALKAGRNAAAAAQPKSMFGANETWRDVLPKLQKPPRDDPNKAT